MQLKEVLIISRLVKYVVPILFQGCDNLYKPKSKVYFSWVKVKCQGLLWLFILVGPCRTLRDVLIQDQIEPTQTILNKETPNLSYIH